MRFCLLVVRLTNPPVMQDAESGVRVRSVLESAKESRAVAAAPAVRRRAAALAAEHNRSC